MLDQIRQIPYEDLPLGFGFHPTGEQLINHYLKPKLNGTTKPLESAIIPETELCKLEPWDKGRKKNFLYGECFFFARIDHKYKTGNRSNRATEKGYWKPSGRDRLVHSNKVPVGTIKTLIFHEGKKGKGVGTGWIIHEYSVLKDASTVQVLYLQGKFVLCRLLKKEGVHTVTDRHIVIHEEATNLTLNQVPPPNMDNQLALQQSPSIKPTIQLQTKSNSGDKIATLQAPKKRVRKTHIAKDAAQNQASRINHEESIFDGLEDILDSDYYHSFISDYDSKHYIKNDQ